MKTRCKMFVSKMERGYQGDTGMQVKMLPVSSGSAENDKFFNCTPSGQLEVNVTNDSLEGIKLGDEFYVDLTLIEK